MESPAQFEKASPRERLLGGLRFWWHCLSWAFGRWNTLSGRVVSIVSVLAAIGGFAGVWQSVQANHAWWLLLALPIVFITVFVAPYHKYRTVATEVRQLESEVYVIGVRAVDFGNGSRPIFFVSVANDGDSRATKVTVTVRVDTDQKATEYKTPQKLDIPRRESREVSMRVSFVVSPEDLENLNKRQARLEVTGSVKYGGKSTPYCYQYKPWDGERPEGVLMFIPCNGDERMNQIVKLRAGAYGLSGGSATLTVKRSTPGSEAPPDPESEGELPET